MVIAIDASRAAGEQKTGVGWYAYHLIEHLKDVIPHDARVLLYSDQLLPDELRPWPISWEECVLKWPPSAIGFSRWPLWSQGRLAERVLRDRPDVLFIPAHVIPLVFTVVPRAVRPRLITTIHDVSFKEYPEAYTFFQRQYADHATRLAVRTADRIIVPTSVVARDLERYYRCDQKKIVVIPHGVYSPPVISTERIVRASGEISDDDKVILYVGRLEHKKNIVRMIEAFERVAAQHTGLRFVLAGQPGYGYDAVRIAIERSPVRDRIVTPGWISREEYQRLLSRASALLFPTLAEGFGLPILESMAAGVPVITSRGGAHEEVAGGAAALVRSDAVEDIAQAMRHILSDPKHRETLVYLGKQRASQFTWENTTRATWGAIQSVLST